eukprot:TRINITY_DN2634_c0_g1_i1.p1 TRINITY_DN2634_c0_g1~~TRINITY_DN2634_c0_g1_i1.p1  ORF type:complete len:244 (+),score=14.66 TRINITY_DN2634_c0_g1_i1:34-765(+)
MVCGTIVSTFITGAIFAAIGIVSLALGASYPKLFCTAMCADGCKGRFSINSSGDMDCDNCFSTYYGGCTSIRVTKQIYAYYTTLVAFGITTLLLAVIISIFRLLQLKGKITVASNKLNTMFLALFFICTGLAIMFFLIQANAAGIACESNCDSSCRSKRVPTFYFAQVNYDSSGSIECQFCVDDGSTSCADETMYLETLTIARVGLGLGIPFVVIGGVFGLLWIVKAVVQPTRAVGSKPAAKA